MSDLVERLRRGHAGSGIGPRDCKDAADEIERLRERIDKAVANLRMVRDMLDVLAAKTDDTEPAAAARNFCLRRETMNYVRWLIEHPDNGKQSPFYFGWEEGEKGWTADINAALKFETRDAAEKMASDVGLPDYQINDHKWLDHEPTSNLDVA